MGKIVGYRKRKDGRAYPIHSRSSSGESLFSERESSRISEIVRTDSQRNAERSVKELDREFESADRPMRLHILRAEVEAANIAQVESENPRISEQKRNEAARVESVYRFHAAELSKKYREEYEA